MYNGPVGSFASAGLPRPKFFESTSHGVCAIRAEVSSRNARGMRQGRRAKLLQQVCQLMLNKPAGPACLHRSHNSFVNIHSRTVAAEGNANTQAADGTAIDGDAERSQRVISHV